MNRYDPTRAYQYRLRRQQEQRRVAIVSYRNGVKAAIKAAAELIKEGYEKAGDFESLVLRRIEEHRKCRTRSDFESNQSQPVSSVSTNPEIKDATN